MSNGKVLGEGPQNPKYKFHITTTSPPQIYLKVMNLEKKDSAIWTCRIGNTVTNSYIFY